MKKYIKCGGNYSPLYHSLNLAQLSEAVNSDRLSPRQHPAICLTRSFRFAANYLRKAKPRSIDQVRCILELNKSKLSDNYKIVPVSDFGNMQGLSVPKLSRNLGDSNTKSEERIYKPVANLSNYVTCIYLDLSILTFPEGNEVVESIKSDGYNVNVIKL